MPLPTLHACAISNDTFFPGLAATFSSAIYSASGQYDYQFYALDGGLDPERVSLLNDILIKQGEEKGIKVSLKVLKVPEEMLKTLPERRGSRMFFAKLLLPELFPELEHIIYLDSDILYLGGIESILPESPNVYLAGVRDYISILANDCPWQESLSKEERNLPYINTGVLWINLAKIRKDAFIPEAIELRSKTKNTSKADQPVFNYFCRGQMDLLPNQLNYCISIGSNKRLRSDWKQMNIHFIGSPKPWLGKPVTHKHLAFTIWHAFAQSFLAPLNLSSESFPLAESEDLRGYQWRSIIYKILNPNRAKNYSEAVKTHKISAKITRNLFSENKTH